MTGLLAHDALMVSLVLVLVGAIMGTLGIRGRRARLGAIAFGAVYTNFVLVTVATLAMIYALVTHDFSISYVAQVGSRETPLFYTVISLWGALEGSILFWAWVLGAVRALRWCSSTASAPAIWCRTPRSRCSLSRSSSPSCSWGRRIRSMPVFPVPADGPGPNPAAAEPHPDGGAPAAALPGLRGHDGAVRVRHGRDALRRGRIGRLDPHHAPLDLLASWGFLSAAIIAGMWWSYEVLGWGGYWAWDPVENASFMPWLTATAFLHSAMVQERRGMLRLWNLNLIVGTFVLTILGTFLTRSGIISSVHAFTQGTIGYYFLAFIAVVLRGDAGDGGRQLRPPALHGAPRLGGLARDGVPAQQPVPHGIHVHGAHRDAVPAGRRSAARA